MDKQTATAKWNEEHAAGNSFFASRGDTLDEAVDAFVKCGGVVVLEDGIVVLDMPSGRTLGVRVLERGGYPIVCRLVG